jgi:hypothetical protein
MKSIFLLSLLYVSYSEISIADDSIPMVEEFCKCTKDSNENLNKAVKKIKEGDVAAANQILQDMQPQMVEMEKCTQELGKKYPPESMSEDEKKKAQALIQKDCPVPAIDSLDLNPEAKSKI